MYFVCMWEVRGWMSSFVTLYFTFWHKAHCFYTTDSPVRSRDPFVSLPCPHLVQELRIHTWLLSGCLRSELRSFCLYSKPLSTELSPQPSYPLHVSFCRCSQLPFSPPTVDISDFSLSSLTSSNSLPSKAPFCKNSLDTCCCHLPSHWQGVIAHLQNRLFWILRLSELVLPSQKPRSLSVCAPFLPTHSEVAHSLSTSFPHNVLSSPPCQKSNFPKLDEWPASF